MLTTTEKARLKELIALKKANKLTDEQKTELAKLNDKCGFNSKKKGKGATEDFKPGNDFSWWNKIPELIRDCANFKCNWIPGTSLAPGAVDVSGVGVAAIIVDTHYGASITATDPINVWARDLYLRMFQKYRPASGYSASDLGIAILAGVEVIKLIALYERIYGIINRYSKLNVNMPLSEAYAMGISPTVLSYLQGHMSDFRYDLNYLVRKAQRLCVPKDLSVVAQAISLFGYEYLDHESARSQFIMFMPNEYGEYSDTRLTSGGSIEFKVLSYVNLFDFNADNMCKTLDDALNALLGSDSIQRIYADLVVWFGQDAMLSILPMPEDYTIVPVKSESILHEMHNIETFDSEGIHVSFVDSALSAADKSTLTGTTFSVYQADDRIVTAGGYIKVPSGATASLEATTFNGVTGSITMSSAASPVGFTLGHPLDTYREDVTPDLIVEGALFKYNHENVNTATNYHVAQVTSSAFYVVRKIVTTQLSNGVPFSTSNFLPSFSGGNAQSVAGRLAVLDWAPLTEIISLVPTGHKIDDIYGDYDNLCYVSNPDLSRIHRSTILSGLDTNMQVVNK